MLANPLTGKTNPGLLQIGDRPGSGTAGQILLTTLGAVPRPGWNGGGTGAMDAGLLCIGMNGAAVAGSDIWVG